MTKAAAFILARTVTRLELYAGFFIIILSLAVSLQIVNHWNRQAQASAKIARAVAVAQGIKSEHVCSKTNQGMACQELFNRLVNNVTPAQRLLLACFVAYDLKRPDLASKLNCELIRRHNP